MPICELAAVAARVDIPHASDAIQAVGQLPVDFAASAFGMSVAAHKFGGPTGVGALLLRRDTACVPLLHAGDRSATSAPHTGMSQARCHAAAARIAVDGLDGYRARSRRCGPVDHGVLDA